MDIQFSIQIPSCSTVFFSSHRNLKRETNYSLNNKNVSKFSTEDKKILFPIASSFIQLQELDSCLYVLKVELRAPIRLW